MLRSGSLPQDAVRTNQQKRVDHKTNSHARRRAEIQIVETPVLRAGEDNAGRRLTWVPIEVGGEGRFGKWNLGFILSRWSARRYESWRCTIRAARCLRRRQAEQILLDGGWGGACGAAAHGSADQRGAGFM